MENPIHNGAPQPTGADAIIIGAGPAGLTAACRLAAQGRKVVVLEAEAGTPGGKARTQRLDGCRVDPGARPFLSADPEVERFWSTLLLERDFPLTPFSARIYRKGRFYTEPFRPLEALRKLGPGEAALAVLSWLGERNDGAEEDFEARAIHRHGRRLYHHFFSSLVEKTYGVGGDELPANTREVGPSLGQALRTRGPALPEGPRFRYPRLGAGMVWKAAAQAFARLGGTLELEATTTHCVFDAESGCWGVEYRRPNGEKGRAIARWLFSSMPLSGLAELLAPALSEEATHSARMLRHRDRVTVALRVSTGAERPFHDQWLDLADPEVAAARLVQYRAWSPEMTPGPETACYGLEYYGFAGDEITGVEDGALLKRAVRDLETLGIAQPAAVHGGRVFRQPRAFPLDDAEGVRHATRLKHELEDRYPGLHLIGRNGTHQEGGPDHAVATALHAVAAAASQTITV